MAAIEVASALSCPVSRLGEHLPADELELWLVHYAMKLGYSFDQRAIARQRSEAFLNKARAHWNK